MRLEVSAAFARDIGDRADRALEACRRVVKGEIALPRQLVLGVQAGDSRPSPGVTSAQYCADRCYSLP